MTLRITWLVIYLLIVVAAAGAAGRFEPGTWYLAIAKPSWAVPSWVFGPVWSVLYVMMAVAMWRAWIGGHYARIGALIWWLLQLSLNVAWSWLFFELHRTGWAMVELFLLIGVVSLCTKAFATVSRGAVGLMTPYLLWLIYTFALNVAIWFMNGGGSGIFYND